MAKQQYSAKDFREDLLRVLASKTGGKADQPVSHKAIYEDVALLKGVGREDHGYQTNTKILWVDRWIQWAFKALVEEGLGKRSGKGQWALTKQGVIVAQDLVGSVATDADDAEDADDTPVVSTGDTVSLMVGPGQSEDAYHNDPYIRALAARDSTCFEAYSDKSPTCTRCPMSGACMNAMAAELSSLARELAQEDKEAEARRKMGISDPKPSDDGVDNTVPASAMGDKARVAGDANLIVVQQQAICKHCGKVIPKGDEGYWIRSTSKNTGGLYHKDCLEVGA